MNAANHCRDFEVLVSLRAAGALEPDEAARLEAHLVTCDACRAEADAEAEALALAKLPPPDEDELAPMRDLPARTLEAFRRTERRGGMRRRFLAGFAVAAAAALAVLTPALLRHSRPIAPVQTDQEVAWEVPSVDGAFEDADLLASETSYGSAQEGGDEADAALAALEYVKGE